MASELLWRVQRACTPVAISQEAREETCEAILWRAVMSSNEGEEGCEEVKVEVAIVSVEVQSLRIVSIVEE